MKDHLSSSFHSNAWFDPSSPCLVAVSGGMDSVALTHAMHSLGVPIHIAHVNYGKRGAESDIDAQAVRALAESLSAPYHELSGASLGPREGSQSFQAWARNVRYEWFMDLCLAHALPAVVTAHHANDQLETMLLNLNRGSGLAGLMGMLTARSLAWGSDIKLYRPLLNVRHAEVLSYAMLHGLKWREDRSNRDLRYARNAIRHELSQMDSASLTDLITAGLALQRRIKAFYERKIACTQPGHRSPDPGHTSNQIRLSTINSLPSWVSGWLVLDLIARLDPRAPRRRSAVHRVLKLVGVETGKYVRLGSVIAWREREAIVFKRVDDSRPNVALSYPLVLQDTIHVEGEFGAIKGTIADAETIQSLDLGAREVLLDIDKLLRPIVLRKWIPGDRFVPLGLKGSQKIKSFLTNERIPSNQKKDVYVLESDGEIAWVVGHRISDAFKITSTTSRAVRLKWSPKLTRNLVVEKQGQIQ